MRWKSHVRFGGRTEETDWLKGQHRASVRSNHVAGTLAAATGAGTKEIMRRLGHATQSAALRYQHATDERDRVLANGIDRLIQAARAEPSAQIVPLHSPEDGAASPSTG